jgi:hypothetical protein
VLIAIGFAVLHLLLGLVLITPAPYEGGDNATYLALAKSLLQNGTYTELWDPAQRSATLYPPLFPLAIAGALSVGLETWMQLKLFTLFISAAGVALSVLWLERVSGRRAALAGGLLLAISPGILAQSTYVLSEGLFWVFTMVALWALSHIQIDRPIAVRDDDRSETHRTHWLILAATAAASAALTRSTGLPLIVAIGGVLLLRRRLRDFAMFSAISILPLVIWSVRGKLAGAPGYRSYVTMIDPYQPERGTIGISEFIQRVFTNAITYITEMAPFLIWSSDAILRPLLIVMILFVIAWGLARLVRKPGVIEIWLLLYAALLLIWPEAWAGERFVLAIVPALIYLMAGAIRALQGRNRTAGSVAFVAVFAVAILMMPPVLLARATRAALCREQAQADGEFVCMSHGYQDFMSIAKAAASVLPRNSVVISRKPTLFFAQSGFRSSMYPLSADTAQFFATADSVGARYVVIDQVSNLAEMYLNPVVLTAPGRFCVEDALSRDHALMMQILPTVRPNAVAADSAGFVPMPACKDLR